MTGYAVPESHPRYQSLMTRERIVDGVSAGVTSMHGLIAQGRGEAFDYLLGERTHDFAHRSIEVAIAALLLAKNPVFSINGNAAVLCPQELVTLATLLGAKLEVNIFHASSDRERAIEQHLRSAGATQVLLPDATCELPGMEHNRRFVHPEGIFSADVVFVPLEDGDRCEALVKTGKRVITVDLNPSSRTARTAQIAIVDNLVRVVQEMIARVPEIKKQDAATQQALVDTYNNNAMLAAARKAIVSQFLE